MRSAARPAAGAAADEQATLFRNAQTGDRVAFGQIVLVNQNRLYNAMLRMVGEPEEARELTQEAFTRALVKIDSFRGESQPYTWLLRIAMNLAISQLRKELRHRTFSLDGEVARPRRGNDQAASLLDRMADNRAPAPDQALLQRERQAQVLAALGTIDAEYRAVLVMRDVDGIDYQQIAEVLGLPLGTLKSRLFRARLALRDALKKFTG